MNKESLSNKFFNTFVVYSISDFVTKIVALVVVPLYAMFLTPKVFGLLELISVSISLITVVGLVGFSNALNRFFWEKDESLKSQEEMFSTGIIFLFIINFCLFLISLIVYYLLQDYLPVHNDLNFMLIAIALLLIPLSNLLSYTQTLVRMRFAPIQFMISGIVGYAFPPILAIILMKFFNLRLEAIFFSSVFFLSISLLYLLLKNGDFFVKRFSGTVFLRFFSYGYPFIFTAIAFWAFTSIDRYFISYFMQLENVGEYSIASKIAYVPLLAFTAFGAAWSPLSMKLRAELKEMRFKEFLGNSLHTSILVGTLICAFIGFYTGEIITLLFPPEYRGGSFTSILLTIGVMLNFTTQITAIGISIAKKTKIFSYLTFITLLINAAGNYMLIPQYGLPGAGIATIISYFFLTVSYLYFSLKLFPIKIFKKKFIASLILCLACFSLNIIFFSEEISLTSLYKLLLLLPVFLFATTEIVNLKKYMDEASV